MVADATAVYQPFAADGYQQAQSRALNYLRTYYGADVTDAAALMWRTAGRIGLAQAEHSKLSTKASSGRSAR